MQDPNSSVTALPVGSAPDSVSSCSSALESTETLPVEELVCCRIPCYACISSRAFSPFYVSVFSFVHVLVFLRGSGQTHTFSRIVAVLFSVLQYVTTLCVLSLSVLVPSGLSLFELNCCFFFFASDTILRNATAAVIPLCHFCDH